MTPSYNDLESFLTLLLCIHTYISYSVIFGGVYIIVKP